MRSVLAAIFDFHLPQRAHDEVITLSWRQNDVATSFWHHNDVNFASCVRWACRVMTNIGYNYSTVFNVFETMGMYTKVVFLWHSKRVTVFWVYSNSQLTVIAATMDKHFPHFGGLCIRVLNEHPNNSSENIACTDILPDALVQNNAMKGF